MATSFTTNLRLRLSDDLTADARYNLERIDLLGTTLDFSGESNTVFRSSADIGIQPNSPELGGSGSGGNIDLGSESQPATEISLYATDITIDGNLNSDNIRIFDADTNYIQLTAPALASNVSFILPGADGSAGQLMKTDGAGQLSFVSPVSSLAASAITVTPSGNLASTNVQAALVELQLDIDSFVTGAVDSVNGQTGDVTLTSSDIAEGSNLYYTSGRFNTNFSGKTTADLTENTNLYYTAARFNTAFSAKSTSDLSEGSNLYYTNGRADGRIAAASIEDLSDVAAMTPNNGEVLTWSTSEWVSAPPTGAGQEPVEDIFSGDNSDVTFVLSVTPTNENWIDIFVEGIYQPKTSYSLATATVTFSQAPPTGTGNIVVISRDY